MIQFMPANSMLGNQKDGEQGFYKIKFTLKTNERFTGNTMMQYMDFGMSNNFYAVQGSDTLICSVCERIPAISQAGYQYLALFNKPVGDDGLQNDLTITIADTVAGFGTTAFKIKRQVLKEMETLTQN